MFEMIMLAGLCGAAFSQFFPDQGQRRKNAGEKTPRERKRRDASNRASRSRQRATGHQRHRQTGGEGSHGGIVQADRGSLWAR